MIDRYKSALRELTQAIAAPGSITYESAAAGYVVETGADIAKMTTGMAYSARLSDALGVAVDLVRANRSHRFPRSSHLARLRKHRAHVNGD